jgi:hypothetical protein
MQKIQGTNMVQEFRNISRDDILSWFQQRDRYNQIFANKLMCEKLKSFVWDEYYNDLFLDHEQNQEILKSEEQWRTFNNTIQNQHHHHHHHHHNSIHCTDLHA